MESSCSCRQVGLYLAVRSSVVEAEVLVRVEVRCTEGEGVSEPSLVEQGRGSRGPCRRWSAKARCWFHGGRGTLVSTQRSLYSTITMASSSWKGVRLANRRQSVGPPLDDNNPDRRGKLQP